VLRHDLFRNAGHLGALAQRRDESPLAVATPVGVDSQKSEVAKPASQEVLGAAHSVAHTEIIRQGKVWEEDVIYKAMDGNPELFKVIYQDVLSKRLNRKTLSSALTAIDGYLDQHYKAHLKPLLAYLKKEDRLVPLSEISDHFAYSQVYPWHLASACEWLERKGRIQKLSAPFKLTKRSREQVEEPAYLFEG
jgi:hypothetical protein